MGPHTDEHHPQEYPQAPAAPRRRSGGRMIAIAMVLCVGYLAADKDHSLVAADDPPSLQDQPNAKKKIPYLRLPQLSTPGVPALPTLQPPPAPSQPAAPAAPVLAPPSLSPGSLSPGSLSPDGLSVPSTQPALPLEIPPTGTPQGPTLPPATLQLPPDIARPQPTDAQQEAAIDKIRRTLSGEDSGAETGNPLFDAMLDGIRSQGSVLDNSALATDPSPTLSLPENRRPSPAPRSPLALGPSDRLQPSEADYQVAEQLLRTARMLAQLERQSDRPSRDELIRQMREQAARLLNNPAPPSAVTRRGRLAE